MTSCPDKGERTHKTARIAGVAGLVVLSAAIGVLCMAAKGFGQAASPQGALVNYIPEDARISGKVIRLFAEGGEQTAVVLGDFSLTMGKHQVSGRDAVLWIGESKVGNATFRNITIYIEGGAKIVEPTGATTSDRTMLVTLHQQGELMVAGASVDEKPLTDFPLYKSAMAARRAEAQRPVSEADATKAVVARGPTTRAATTGPAINVAVVEKPKPVRPVTFEAKQGGTSEVRGSRRITIARDIYLSIGTPDYQGSMEITCQSAVLFSERRPPKDATVPWSPKFGGAATNLPGSKEQKETLVGAYLEGDVIIRNGERTIRAPSAYYDFMTDRALMVDPVIRSVQEQRNIPIYVRAEDARVLSAREMQLKNAQISSSDLYTPSYSVGAKTIKLTDTTPYDEEGVRVGAQGWRADMNDVTLNLENQPFFWIPKAGGDLEQESTALRNITVGNHGQLGMGVASEWHLFRLLGLVPPKGFDARLELDYYDRGPMIGSTLKYDRDTYSGYASVYGLYDTKGEDNFGEENQNIPAPDTRGRLLARHKQILPQDWEIQAEVSYISDKNYLQEFFPDEYYTGKEQETLLYAKQQRDNWALTGLMQYRLNRFLTQTESAPDIGFNLVGQPLAGGAMTYFNDSRAGIKHFQPGNSDPNYTHDSDWMPRLDTRNELDAPIKLGPVNVVPYTTGRASYWGDTIPGGSDHRLFGEAGVRASTSLWRTYKDVSNRMLDVNGLKHVITPEAVAFFSGVSGQDDPNLLYPMDPDVEQHLNKLSGGAVGVTQRLMTRRGPEGDMQQADWMRLKVMAGFYDKQWDTPQSDGRFFWSRPEYSLARNFINTEYTWNISDSTIFMFDTNYDIDSGQFGRTDVGLAVSRDPRLRYYIGWRKIREINSSAITAGVDYQINRKYSISIFEQYDLDYDNGRNLGTSVSIIRKFERWYAALTFVVDQRDTTGGTNYGLTLSFWPEGVPEVRIGNGRTAFNSSSSMN